MTIDIGVDVGGTFTDFLLVDRRRGTLETAKVPTTVDDRSRGFMEGIAALGVAPSAIDWLVHGTTAGTNAVLERNGAPSGLITTEGFRDALELGRRTRPHAYGLSGTFRPVIERRRRLEVRERIQADGAVAIPLDEEGVRAAAERLLALGVESVVVHFLHSYVEPAHERRAAEIVRAVWPNEHVVAGHEIMREMREFERGSTAAVHAAISPVVSRYVGRVAERLREEGFRRELLVMQANGGMMAASVVREQAVQTVMSGPAAGVLAAAALARATGADHLVTGDMGGTSFDVALVAHGTPVVTAEKDLAYGLPLRVPMIDIHTIGAGGGSIARVDEAGMIRVGPQSAGSVPGPIGYGRGGERPTITDANLMLGRLNPRAVTGTPEGAPMERVAGGLAEHVGAPFGLDATAAAEAILEVAVAELAGAIRLVSIEKGHDPRGSAFMPFGGAGPLHAVRLARELGIPRVIVPRFPGLTSALGCILADVRHDFVQTFNAPLATLDAARVEETMAAQAEAGRQLLAREKVEVTDVVVEHAVDLLFRGQSHVLAVPLMGGRYDPRQVAEDFHAAYRARFDLDLPEMTPILVNVRTTVTGRRDPLDLSLLAPKGGDLSAARRGRRPVIFAGERVETAIFSREELPVGAEIAGPAIVEQPDSTFVLDPGATARVDAFGNLDVAVGETRG